MTQHPTVLVTGAAGGIGRRVRALLDVEEFEASFAVSPRSAPDVDDPLTDVVDITDGAAFHAVIARRKPDVIIHLAAVTGAKCESDSGLAQTVNVEAVRSLADAAITSGVQRIVLASTSAVYGDQYDAPVDEGAPLVLGSRYAQTKREAELVLAAAASARLTAVSLRIFNVYGPGMDSSLANRLVHAPVDAAVTLAGLDSFVRDYVHVDDVARALVLAAHLPLTEPWTTVNVGSGQPTSNRQLVAALHPVHAIEAEPRVSYSCASVALARRVLGFDARVPLSRGSIT